MRPLPPDKTQRGISLIELMVAVAIGILSVYAVYFVYDKTGQVKRNVIASGETQLSGLYALLYLNGSISSAGAGFLNHSRDLMQCPVEPLIGSGNNPEKLSLRPIPVAIKPAGDPGNPLSSGELFVSHLTASPPLMLDAALSADHTALVVTGMPVALAQKNDVFLVIEQGGGGGTGRCEAVRVADAVTNGNRTTLTFADNDINAVPPGTRAALDMGLPLREHFFVKDETLMVERWAVSGQGLWERSPADAIAGNVVAFHVQYGVSNSGSGNNGVEKWVKAEDEPALDWNAIAAASPGVIGRIKAVRVGMIVRLDEPDRHYQQSPTLTLFENCQPATSCPKDCQLTASCPGMVSVNFANPGAQGLNWRYRAYETIIPLRNSVWNPNSDLI